MPPPKAESAEISKYQSELETLNQQIRDKDELLANANERREKIAALRRETEAAEQRVRDTKEYLAEAAEAMKGFPTENELQRLKERLDTLKIDLDRAEGSVFTSTTGLQAYAQRRQRNMEAMLMLTTALSTSLNEITADVVPRVEEEESVRSAGEVRKGLDQMLEIDEDREDRLQAVLKTLESLMEEEATKKEDYAALARAGEEELPEIEQERNECLAEITAEWQKEREQLTSIYIRLLTLNKEQHHHLVRGTHVKRAPQQYTEVTLATLNSQHARLNNDVTSNSAVLTDILEDLAVVKKQNDKTREAGRQQQAEFEKALGAKQQALDEAVRALEEAKEEGNELRDLKAELQQALHDMRDSKTIMMASVGVRHLK